MSDVPPLQLRRGDWVEVRAAAEILATLDEHGALDGLPFMPEMLAFCGRRFPVRSRADSTCDTVSATGMRRMDNTVHLATLRCDGSAHGGCQAGCLLFWKEAWLRPISNTESPAASNNGAPHNSPSTNGSPTNGSPTTSRDPAWLALHAIQSHPTDPEIRYRCQATELKKASRPLPWWQPGQYLRDIFVNRESPVAVIRGFLGATLNKLTRRFLGRGFPNVAGPLKHTPTEELNLQPGDWVVVKSREEIVATLDKSGRNRGLVFDGEMLPYCGQRFRVLHRVERMLEESTGRMLKPRGASVILENVYCTSRFRRICPRAIYSYWREIWLRRVPAPTQENLSAHENQPLAENEPSSPSGKPSCLGRNVDADHFVPGG
jgi:hypothetical protein